MDVKLVRTGIGLEEKLCIRRFEKDDARILGEYDRKLSGVNLCTAGISALWYWKENH